MKNLLKKFKSRGGGAFLVSVLFVFLVVGCKDDDNNGQFSGEYYFRISKVLVTDSTVTTIPKAVASSGDSAEIKSIFYHFNFPYLYATEDKICDDFAQFTALAGDVTFYGHEIDGKDTAQYEEKKATLTTHGNNLVSFKTKDNTSYEFAFDGTKLTSFALKEDGTATIELEDEKIKTIGSITPAYSQKDFSYPTGVKIKLDTVKVGEDKFIKQNGKITFDTLKGNNYLVLFNGEKDSLFCITTKTENSIIRSYRTWGYDTLVISGTKDTTIIVEQKTVKSKVDPTKDSLAIKKKKITLPLLIDNLDDAVMKLDGKDFVFVETVKSKKMTTADSTITDTLKIEDNVTYPVLRSQVYKYHVIVRYPREVWKSEIKYFTGLNYGTTVKYIGDINVEEITYEQIEKYATQTYKGNPSKFKEKEHSYNTIKVLFGTHRVTK